MRGIACIIILIALFFLETKGQDIVCKTKDGPHLIMFMMCSNDVICSELVPELSLIKNAYEVDVHTWIEDNSILDSVAHGLRKTMDRIVKVNEVHASGQEVDNGYRQLVTSVSSLHLVLPRLYADNSDPDAIDCVEMVVSGGLNASIVLRALPTFDAIKTHLIFVQDALRCEDVNMKRAYKMDGSPAGCVCIRGRDCQKENQLVRWLVYSNVTLVIFVVIVIGVVVYLSMKIM